ncbi:MAG TPA: GntR family transcriptional regulator [Candidatus Baltobacteraceae bacterium]|nr:GntR family transcriptional regulator [Candidatus Baltobacteraceae bacterium]
MTDGFLVVDESSETPPYRQIVEQIRGAIERGDLKPGASLPTVRQMAGDLDIAPNTVARAYSDLQESGHLVSDGRRGTHVADDAPKRDRYERARALRDTVTKFVETLRQRGFTPQEVAAALRQAQGDTRG